MNRYVATTRIITASNIICNEDMANVWATSLLIEYILGHRTPDATLKRYVDELEKQARQILEKRANG